MSEKNSPIHARYGWGPRPCCGPRALCYADSVLRVFSGPLTSESCLFAVPLPSSLCCPLTLTHIRVPICYPLLMAVLKGGGGAAIPRHFFPLGVIVCYAPTASVRPLLLSNCFASAQICP